MILPITLFGDPVLRTVGGRVENITDEIKSFVADMIETMRDAEGVGLAAQQVAVPLQIAVIDVSGIEDRPSKMWVEGQEVNPDSHMPMVLINPELSFGKQKVVGVEGCLSFPKMTADIIRFERVHCRATNLDGINLDFEAEGLLARALQHEIDHLNGVLFIDRMNSAAKAGLAGKLKRLMRAHK